ncbi:hypothetical protein CTAYLR_003076 [Chrysophaeum taylorii]|uniref:RNA helicase n=1 Tax=Chrysophaeum taylorii TaxID=2483200 RepID=A0AAD7XJP7_9STRA|nr:hypothetical protein CTAYLR_003076 [Chrysophaeum taylorii]
MAGAPKTARRAVATMPEAALQQQHSTSSSAAWGGSPERVVSVGEESGGGGAETIASRADIDPRQAAGLAKRGITTFTEIQALSFDPVYQGRDLLGKSRTGTGKTIAFGLPLIERLAARSRDGEYKQRTGRGPAIVVLTPTRELAKQVEQELALLCAVHDLKTVCFHGGVSYTPQERALKRGVDVLVATVGRVIDHLDRGNLDLSKAYHVVLDEADEMLSMGFAEDVERIFSECPAGERVSGGKQKVRDDEFFDELFDDDADVFGGGAPKKQQQQRLAAEREAPVLERRPQTLLFSATAPSWVKKLTSRYLEKHATIDVVGDTKQQAATTVTHKAVLVPRGDNARAALLEDIITVEVSSQKGQESDDVVGGGGRAIVFASTKRECDELAGSAAFKRLAVQVLHGDIGQSQREATLAQFRRGAFQVLIATDVAARGIDVRGVDLVVQYRTPRDAEGYVHRSGRTGRAGRDGTAVVLYDEREERDVLDLERLCGLKFHRQGPPSSAAVLKASARDATMALEKVSDDVLPYFKSTADALVESVLNGPAEELVDGDDDDGTKMRLLVAKCLAAIARKPEVLPRSLLTGDDDTMTLSMTAPRDLRTGDVVYAVARLLERLPSAAAADDLGDAKVGAVRVCAKPNSAVFDLPAKKARELLHFIDTQKLSKFSFTECHELPQLQRTQNDRAGSRYGGGGRGGGGGGYRRGGDRDRDRGGYRGRDGGRPRRDASYGGRGSYNRGRRDYSTSRDNYRPRY